LCTVDTQCGDAKVERRAFAPPMRIRWRFCYFVLHAARPYRYTSATLRASGSPGPAHSTLSRKAHSPRLPSPPAPAPSLPKESQGGSPLSCVVPWLFFKNHFLLPGSISARAAYQDGKRQGALNLKKMKAAFIWQHTAGALWDLCFWLRGFKDPQLPNISTFMNQPYPLRALRTRNWGV
jgi:hypothetical protein